jgi:hypothetical protein
VIVVGARGLVSDDRYLHTQGDKTMARNLSMQKRTTVPQGWDVIWRSHYYDANGYLTGAGWYYVAVNHDQVNEGEEFGPFESKQAAIDAICFGE